MLVGPAQARLLLGGGVSRVSPLSRDRGAVVLDSSCM